MSPNENERAIEILGSPVKREMYRDTVYLKRACEVAVEALEKQIPKKIQMCNRIFMLCKDYDSEIELEKYIKDFENKNGYCFECGQRVRWEQNNENWNDYNVTRQDCINCKYCKQQTEYCGYYNTYNLLICNNEQSICFEEIINPFDKSECKYFKEKEIELVSESIKVINLIY